MALSSDTEFFEWNDIHSISNINQYYVDKLDFGKGTIFIIISIWCILIVLSDKEIIFQRLKRPATFKKTTISTV